MTSKRIGSILFIIGVLYMFIMGWLLSWWYVPDIRHIGFNFVSNTSFYSGDLLFTLWAISVPLGSIIVGVGLSLYANLEKKHLSLLIVSAVILIVWLALWRLPNLISPLYGIGGGVMLLSFFISLWFWAKKRMSLSKGQRLASDFRMIGAIFFVIAAWGLCGTLGVPGSALNPEIMMNFNTQSLANTMGAKVLICLTLGWVFFAMGSYVSFNKQ